MSAQKSRPVCLNHQDRETDLRCRLCLKPVCTECALDGPEGRFCSTECRQKTLESEQRMAEQKARDEVAQAAAKRAAMMRTLTTLAILAALLLGGLIAWPYAPASVRAPVAKLIKSVQGLTK